MSVTPNPAQLLIMVPRFPQLEGLTRTTWLPESILPAGLSSTPMTKQFSFLDRMLNDLMSVDIPMPCAEHISVISSSAPLVKSGCMITWRTSSGLWSRNSIVTVAPREYVISASFLYGETFTVINIPLIFSLYF